MPSPGTAQTRAWGPLGQFADFFGDSAEALPCHHSSLGFVEGPGGTSGDKHGLESSEVRFRFQLCICSLVTPCLSFHSCKIEIIICALSVIVMIH